MHDVAMDLSLWMLGRVDKSLYCLHLERCYQPVFQSRSNVTHTHSGSHYVISQPPTQPHLHDQRDTEHTT